MKRTGFSESSTWLLLHSLASKIKEEKLIENKEKINNLIEDICKNLQCPVCVEHSTNYLNGNKITLDSKNELINYLYIFHNIINKITNKKIISIDIISNYENVKILNILENYINKNINPDLLEHNKVYYELENKIKENIDWFN